MAPSISRITNPEPNLDRTHEAHEAHQRPVRHQNTAFASALGFVQHLYHSAILPPVPSHSSESDNEVSLSTPILPGSYPESESSSPATELRSEFSATPSATDGATHNHEAHVAATQSRYGSPPSRTPSTVSGLPMSPTTVENTGSALKGAHNFTVRDHARIMNMVGVNNVTNYGGSIDLDVMKKFMEEFVSFNALHDSPVQDPDRQCHPETRRGVLKQLQDWIDNPDTTEPICLLHGPAGVGKSAIAQTIARTCSGDKVPVTFFFYRSDPSRNDGNRLFTTLAWQLALSIPSFKSHLIHSLNERPDLPRKDVETQFEKLIVRPLQALNVISSQTRLPAPIIIIDGVDECVDNKLQRRILKVIGSAISGRRVPLRFLICSRPEAHIQQIIDSFQCPTFILDLANLNDAYKDIEKYFKAEFSRIASEQGLDPSWPGEVIIRKFVYKSSGQFIYASTLIRFIDDEHNSATYQLDIVLGFKPFEAKKPFAELDALYMEILKRQPDWNFLNDILSLFVGSFLSIFLPTDNSIETYAILMNLSEQELCKKLCGMRSLLKLDLYVDVYHQSFLDFLEDSSSSSQYHINQQAAERRSLDIIATSIVRHVPIILEQPDCHERHFSPRIWINRSMLSVDELQEALQPVMQIQVELFAMENSWQRFLRCSKCKILFIMRNLLLYLTCRQEASKHDATHCTKAVEQGLTEHAGTLSPLTPFVSTKVKQIVLEKSGLDDSLSSVLAHLREMKLPLSTMIIDLMCSLLSFDCVEIAIRICSIPDGQLLVDVIDHLISNGEFVSRHGTAIVHKAARLALEVHARVPVLPRSMVCSGDLPRYSILHGYDLMSSFTPTFTGRILDRNYVLRVLWTFKEGRLTLVHDSKNICESIREWRRSNPSLVMMLRVMLEVANAIQYIDSMDVLLDHSFDLRDIFLDSMCHVKIFPWGTILSLTRLSSEEVHQRNVFILGCTFYELAFDARLRKNEFRFNNDMIQGPMRPSELEISDELWRVIHRCYAADPKSRPTIDEVVKEMESWKID